MSLDHLQEFQHDHLESLLPQFVLAKGALENLTETWVGQLQILFKKFKESGFELFEIQNSSVEYTTVLDRVMRYILPVHQWVPRITKIEKIHSRYLEFRFEEAKSRCIGTLVDQKFHGTSEEGIRKIPKEGFRLPKPALPGERKHMYGAGIYFSTDSSKSAQDIYTKGCDKLLLCDVLLGEAKKVEKADQTLSLEKIRREGFDSVFAPRDTKSSGGVMNDEFIIFDPDQALPRYIIHYVRSSSTGALTIKPLKSLTTKSFYLKTIPVLSNRIVDLSDPYKPHCDYATSVFYKVPVRRKSYDKASNLTQFWQQPIEH